MKSRPHIASSGLNSIDQTLEYLLLQARSDGRQRRARGSLQGLPEGKAVISNVDGVKSARRRACVSAAEGDVAAFEEIDRRYRRLTYTLVLAVTSKQADAEDVTQEPCVSVLLWVGTFRGEAYFTTWLYRLTANQVEMHFVRRRSGAEEQTSDGQLPELQSDVAHGVNTDQLIDGIDIETAAGRLPPSYRAALILPVICYLYIVFYALRGSTLSSERYAHS